MMNKKTMLLFLGTMTLGCAASTNAQAPLCPPLNNLKLTVDEYHLSLNDKRPICVTTPGTFTITIHQPGNSTVTIAPGDATVEQKEGSSLTIVGNNEASAGKIKINVSGNPGGDDIFEFWIKVRNVGALDPKVRVIPSSVLTILKSEAFYDTLDILDLTLEDANKLKPPQPSTSE